MSTPMKTQSPDEPATQLGDKSNAEAVATRDQKPIDESLIRNQAAEMSTAQPANVFEPFRLWVNRRIRNLTAGPKLTHRELEYVATEITTDGRIRMIRGEQVVLVEFDEEFIQPLLEQLL